MTEPIKDESAYFAGWIAAERLFMRFVGIALIVIAAVSITSSVLNNPENQRVITGVNILITIAFLLTGCWELWRSGRDEHVQNIVHKFADQPSGYAKIAAVVQIVTALFFLLEGFTGNWTVLLLAVLLFIYAGWLFRRDQRIARYQKQFYETE